MLKIYKTYILHFPKQSQFQSIISMLMLGGFKLSWLKKHLISHQCTIHIWPINAKSFSTFDFPSVHYSLWCINNSDLHVRQIGISHASKWHLPHARDSQIPFVIVACRCRSRKLPIVYLHHNTSNIQCWRIRQKSKLIYLSETLININKTAKRIWDVFLYEVVNA